MYYTAIIPSRTASALVHCVASLRANSLYLANYIGIWDGAGAPVLPKVVAKPEGADVYGMYNYGAQQATGDWLLFANDDMYFPAGWDRALPKTPLTKAFYTFSLVESGWQEVHERNIKQDFGQEIALFDRSGFEQYAKERSTHKIRPGLGWYMPLLIHRDTFMGLGQYPTVPPFPATNDVSLFNKAEAEGLNFFKIDSMVYHFQCLSQREGA